MTLSVNGGADLTVRFSTVLKAIRTHSQSGRAGVTTRRRFLGSLGTGAGLAGCPWIGWTAQASAISGDTRPESAHRGRGRLVRHTRACSAFGAEASVIVLHESDELAARAIDSAMAELREVENLLSLYRPDSALRRLNHAGVIKSPHPWLVQILQKAIRLSQQTNGAFDVTVQPLWELYAAAKESGRLPALAEVETIRRKVDWRKVAISPNEIHLRETGMAVTLNALAQGFAADRVLAVLRQHGIRHALVNTGEIGAMGAKEGGEPWTVGIQHPRRLEAYIALASLTDAVMATSGDYATRFDEDFRRHHIFDPATGQSPVELSSATVVAPTGLDADGLATAIMLVGHQRGIELVESLPGAEAFLVLKDGRTMMTPRFPIF